MSVAPATSVTREPREFAARRNSNTFCQPEISVQHKKNVPTTFCQPEKRAQRIFLPETRKITESHAMGYTV